MPRCDIVVIGGGIIGLATAWELSKKRPDDRLVLLEKENELAVHQTGRNSGVLHSGIYYRPGSQKALLCREGKLAMERFCAEEGIAYETCGKVVVAVDESELPALDRIGERAHANGVECQRISRDRLRELEPHAAGVAALHVPETGIVDYKAVSDRLGDKIRSAGSVIRFGETVSRIDRTGDTCVVRTSSGEYDTAFVVNCTGLYSDRVARLSGFDPGARIVPFRGEYFELRESSRHLCRNLIYPVPDPSFPFLGVHFTRMVNGTVECGPNAVLAFAREGYTKTCVNFRDLAESLAYPGFLRLARRHWRTGLGEMWRSVSKQAFVRALQRLLPEITAADVEPAPAGVRAQAVTQAGALVDDFLLSADAGALHVTNAPSPAATASLRIGEVIAGKVNAIRIAGG